MRIPHLIKLISECWQEAEKSTSFLLATRYHDEDEPFITNLFHGELGVAVKEASDKGRVRRAFLQDIQSAFPEIDHSAEIELRISEIGATVTFHPGKIERLTGGDLGLVRGGSLGSKLHYTLCFECSGARACNHTFHKTREASSIKKLALSS